MKLEDKFTEMEKNLRLRSPPSETHGSKKKRGNFLNTLGFFVFFFLLIMAGVIATAYSNRDRLLLEYLRQEGPRLLGVEVFALDSVITRPVGQVSVEIKNLVFQSSEHAPLLRAETVLLSTPKNILSLYQLMFTHDVLPLKAQFIGMHLQATTHVAGKNEAKAVTLKPPSDFKIKALPFPVSLETEIRDSTIEAGSENKPIKFQNITGIVRTEVSNRPQTNAPLIKSSGQLSLGMAIGEKSQLPFRTEWAFNVEPNMLTPSNIAIDVTSLTISALGITLKSTGKLKWPEQVFSIEAAGSTADLGVLPVDKSESEALGLTGRLKGSADVSIKAAGSLAGVINAQGLIRVKGGHFPFDINSLRAANSDKKAKPFQIKGPAELELEAPFKIAYDVATSKLNSVELQMANFKLDLTGADIRSPGLIRKPAQTMMTAQGQITAQGETIEVSNLEFRLANLFASAKGQVSIDPKRLSKLDLTLTLPSLKGWPTLLPILGELDARTASQAQGSFALKAQAEFPFGALDTLKTNSQVTVETFDASGVEFPVNFSNGKKNVEGLVRASLSASGSASTGSMSWSLKRAHGAIDLKAVAIHWEDLFEKPLGQDVALDFLIAAPGGSTLKPSDLLLKIERVQMRALGSSAAVNGTVLRDSFGDLTVDLDLQSRVILSEIYSLAPVLRSLQAKLPSGTVVTSLHANGIYRPKLGPAKSPIGFSGRIALKSPRAVLLGLGTDANHSAETAKPEQDAGSMLDWPLVAKSKLAFDLQFETIAIKTTTLKNVAILANLQNGDLRGSMAIEDAFSGSAKITSFAVMDLARKNFLDLKTSATGQFHSVNLAQFAEFLGPQWKGMVGGITGGTFNFAGRPFHSTPLVDNATANGTLKVQKGFLSTFSLDQMVNQKLTEFPIIAKVLGAKPKLATKGVNLDMMTAFSFAKGQMDLKGFKAVSPEKNELNLDGWLKKDLTAQLAGFAYLIDTPVGGSFREANSDKQGRLVVPIKISGSLKEPSLKIAEDVVTEMTKKTVTLETAKLKSQLKKEFGKVIETKKQEATKSAVDAVKEEFKKRGLGF